MATKSATRKGVLNARQLRFVEEYLVDMNATQAAIRAGYSKKTAGQTGYDLLKHPQIGPALDAKRKELSHKTGITVERVLMEQARIAFLDIRKLFADDGSMKGIHELDDDTAAAISAIEVDELFENDGDAGKTKIGVTRKVKLWDKGKQLENLLKHLGAEGGKEPEAIGGVMAATPGLDALVGKLASLIKTPKVEA